MQTFCQTSQGEVEVSTCDTFDRGWETMIFRDRGDGTRDSGHGVMISRYDSADMAARGHQKTVVEIETVLPLCWECASHGLCDDCEMKMEIERAKPWDL